MTVTIFFSIYFNHNLKLTQFSNQANCWIKLGHKIGHKISKLQKKCHWHKDILYKILPQLIMLKKILNLIKQTYSYFQKLKIT
jgi:hypothetical protein